MYIIAVILGIIVGVLFDIFLIREFPDHKKGVANVITVIVFIVTSVLLFATFGVKSSVNKTVIEKSGQLEQYIKINYPDNELVNNGINITFLNENTNNMEAIINEIKTMLPSANELNIDKNIYNWAVNYTIKIVKRKVAKVEYYTDFIKSFSDNSVLTVSSIIKGLRNNILVLFNQIILIINSVIVILLIVYVIYCLLIIHRERKFKNM